MLGSDLMSPTLIPDLLVGALPPPATPSDATGVRVRDCISVPHSPRPLLPHPWDPGSNPGLVSSYGQRWAARLVDAWYVILHAVVQVVFWCMTLWWQLRLHGASAVPKLPDLETLCPWPQRVGLADRDINCLLRSLRTPICGQKQKWFAALRCICPKSLIFCCYLCVQNGTLSPNPYPLGMSTIDV